MLHREVCCSESLFYEIVMQRLCRQQTVQIVSLSNREEGRILIGALIHEPAIRKSRDRPVRPIGTAIEESTARK